MEWKPVSFKIAGVEKNEDSYLVAIPSNYKELFEGHNFPSLEIFRRALLYARVAQEAMYLKRSWVQEAAERSLMRCLEI